MTEVFKPRANMVSVLNDCWICCDRLGRYMCDGGPSVIYNDGRWEFLQFPDGFHRLDGPALSTGKWWIKGKHVTDEIHQFAEENNINLENLSDEDKVLIALKFG